MAQAHEPETPATAPLGPGDAFVFLPRAHRTTAPHDNPALLEWDGDRPAAAWTLARMVVAVALVAGLMAAAVYTLGFLVKLQLDKVFAP